MEKIKGSLLTIVSSIIGIVLLVQLLILAIVISTKLAEENFIYGNNFAVNWSLSPIQTIDSENSTTCPIGYSYGIPNTYFPGFKSGCYCPKSKSYFPDSCSNNQLSAGCESFPESAPKLIVSWGGSICTKRKATATYFTLNKTDNTVNSTCSDDTKDCGFLDTLNSKFCVNKKEECPVNYLKVVNVNDNSTSKNLSFAVSEAPFSSVSASGSLAKKKFVYSNNNTLGKIVNQFMILDHKPCANSLDNKIQLSNPNNNSTSQSIDAYSSTYCHKNISDYMYDPSWVLLDTMTVEELVIDNGLNSTLSVYPFWNDIKTKTVGLYYRNYIGLNQTCIDLAKQYFYPKDANSIPLSFFNIKTTLDNSNIDFISVTSASLYIITLVALIMKIITFCEGNKQSYRMYINLVGAFCTLMLLIIGIISTISISNARNKYIWVFTSSHCSDPIDQGLLNEFDSNIREAYVIAVIFTILSLILFFTMIIEYLLRHCYEENDSENLEENLDELKKEKEKAEDDLKLLNNEELTKDNNNNTKEKKNKSKSNSNNKDKDYSFNKKMDMSVELAEQKNIDEED